jgi:toxin ParE1/3/4
MAAIYRIIITIRAAVELEEIHQYISRNSPENASRVATKIIAAIDSLNQLPHRYPVHQGRRQPSQTVRRMPVRPYLIYYRIDDRRMAVTIISVRHGARKQPRKFD